MANDRIANALRIAKDIGGGLTGYQDAPAPKLQDMPWRPLQDVHADLGGMSEIPSHVQHFGRFMDETSNKAATKGLSARDILKAYLITRASIGRGAVNADTIRRPGFEIPHVTGKIRPEGAMGEWLHTPMGQAYLAHAERGKIHEGAVQHAMAVMRPFGKASATEGHALPWAAQNIPGMEGHISKMVAAARHAKANPAEWREFIKGIPGVATSKAGFIGSMLGRGDQPTLDARQIILHTGRPTSEAAKPLSRVGGAEQAVDRLSARQNAMNLSLPEELRPYYQHLAHHAVWDKVAGEQTTHEDLMNAMRHAEAGGRIEKDMGGELGGGSSQFGLGDHEVARALHASFGQNGGLGGLWQLPSDQQVRSTLLRTPDFSNPDPAMVQRALELQQKTHAVNPTFNPKAGMGYSSFKGGTMPIGDVQSTVENIPGVQPKPINKMDWDDFIRQNKGASLINIGGDRSRLGRLTHINNQKLGWPVDLHAGPDYMREANPGAVWANAKGNATSFRKAVKRLSERGPVFGIYKPMGPKSVDSSVQMSDALMSQIHAKPLDKKVAAEIDAAVKSGVFEPNAKKRAKAAAAMEGWPGIGNPREASDFLKTRSGALRSLLVKHLDKADWHKKGVPHIGHTRVAITDPAVLNTPGNMLGHRIIRLTGDNPDPRLLRFQHNTYPVATGGEYVGDVEPVMAHHAMPEVTRGFVQNPHKGGVTHPLSEKTGARNAFLKMFGEQKNVQPINEEMAHGVGHALEMQKQMRALGVPGYEKGGVVEQALRVTARPAKAYAEGGMPERQLNPSGFYSGAAEAAQNLPQQKATMQQMGAALQRRSVKPVEMTNSGLDFNSPTTANRDELARHFTASMPQLHETEYWSPETARAGKGMEYDAAGKPTWRHRGFPMPGKGAAKYEQYTIPGGHNYRELLLHAPVSARPVTDEEAHQKAREVLSSLGADFDRYPPEKQAAHIEGARQQLEVERRLSNDENSHRSEHWDEPNVVAHLRMSERNIPKEKYYDPSIDSWMEKGGKPETMLHLEELQSDWRNAMREHAGKSVRTPEEEQEMHSLYHRQHGDQYLPAAERASREETARRIARLNELGAKRGVNETAPPSHPYLGSANSHIDLGLKRALIEAARGGHSRLAWTSDETQRERYPEGREDSELYNKVIPNRLKDIVKKLGHVPQLEDIRISHPPNEKDEDQDEKHAWLNSLKLSPELRAKILKGLPAFSEGGDVEPIPEGYADGGKVAEDMPEPQQTVKAYKLFRHKNGKLYPLYVNADQEVPIGKWLRAEAGPQGKDKGKVKSKLGDLAYRPGWHSGDMPVATHIGSKSKKRLKAPDTRPPEHVWAEVEHPADVDWQSVANSRAEITKAGKPNLRTAHITDQVPHGGFYRYKTNSNMTGNWLISGGMKVNRVLPDEEVAAINQQHGVYDLPRREPSNFQPQDDLVNRALRATARPTG